MQYSRALVTYGRGRVYSVANQCTVHWKMTQRKVEIFHPFSSLALYFQKIWKHCSSLRHFYEFIEERIAFVYHIFKSRLHKRTTLSGKLDLTPHKQTLYICFGTWIASKRSTSWNNRPSQNIQRVETSNESNHPTESEHSTRRNVRRFRTSIRVRTSNALKRPTSQNIHEFDILARWMFSR